MCLIKYCCLICIICEYKCWDFKIGWFSFYGSLVVLIVFVKVIDLVKILKYGFCVF